MKVTASDLDRFARENGWLLIDASDEDDLKIGDDYLLYLTPSGKFMRVKFNKGKGVDKLSRASK